MENLENTFDKLQNEFDFAEPNVGHFERFEAKMKAQNSPNKKPKNIKWYWLSAAASVLLLFGFSFGPHTAGGGIELAEISPKMEETQNFYLATIQKEIKLIDNQRTPQNQKIIDDALVQLEILEKNHQKLSIELKESNEDKRVIYAMIANFQMQIEVLQNLVDQLEKFKNYQNLNPEENKI